jgi:competence protein ComEC
MRELTIKYPAALLFIFMVSVAIFANQLQSHPHDHISHYINATYWEITGIIAERPTYKSPNTRLIIRVTRLKNRECEHSVSGKIRLSVWNDISHYKPGLCIRFVSRIYPFTNFNNPGGFDYKKYMNFHRQIFGNAYPKNNQIHIVNQAPEDGFQQKLYQYTQTKVSQMFTQYTSLQASSLLHAIVLGDRELLNSKLRETFVSTGVSHLLAISGLHMGMIAMTAFLFFRWLFRRSERLCLYGWSDFCAAIPAFILMTAYLIISGMSPSAQRAFVMITVFLCAQVFSKEQIALNTLCFAGSLILLWDIRSLTDISFQMSFCAVFFIIIGFQRLPEHWLLISNAKAVQYFWQMLICSTLAIIATSPLALHYFYQTSFMGLFTNIVAIPLIGFIVLPFALLSVIFVFIWKSIAIQMIAVSGYACDVLIILIKSMKAYSQPFELQGHLGYLELFVWYAIVSLFFVNLKSKIKYVLISIFVLIMMIDIAYWSYQRYFHDDLRITVLDVGLGNSALVDLPGGDCVMVDGGGLSSSFDIGQHVVAPYLWRNKIISLKTLILTHPDQDHLQGLIFLAKHFHVKTAWTNGDDKQTYLFKTWQKTLKDMHIKTIQIRAGFQKNFGLVNLKCFNPPVEYYFEDTNNNSLVFQLQYQQKTILFTGDIEHEAESLLCKTYCNDLKSDLLMCPHHGSRSSSSMEWIHCVQPAHVVVSASGYNRHHLPDAGILKRYTNTGSQLFSTGRDGAIMIAISKKGLLDIRAGSK